jgi:hypothetical protein
MPMLLTDATAPVTGTGVLMDGPSIVYCRGSLGGANVVIEVAPDNIGSKYGEDHRFFTTPDQKVIDAPGSYWVRAVIHSAKPGTNVSVEITQ